jgi:sulfonate transport system permease protein
MLGFSAGTIMGLIADIALGLSRLADRLFMPSFSGPRQIAILAWIPLILVWCGVGQAAKIVFSLMAASIPVLLNT